MQEATDLGHVFQQHLLVDLGPVHDDGWFCAAFGSKAGQSGHGRKSRHYDALLCGMDGPELG